MSGGTLINMGINNTDDYFITNPHKFDDKQTVGIFELTPSGAMTFFYASNPTPKLPVLADNTGNLPSVNLQGQFGSGDKLFKEMYSINKEVALKFEDKLKLIQTERDELKTENAELKAKFKLIEELGGMTNVFDALNFYKEYGNGNAQKLSDRVKMESGQQWKENIYMKSIDVVGNIVNTIANNTTSNPRVQEALADILEVGVERFGNRKPKASNSFSNSEIDKDEPVE